MIAPTNHWCEVVGCLCPAVEQAEFGGRSVSICGCHDDDSTLVFEQSELVEAKIDVTVVRPDDLLILTVPLSYDLNAIDGIVGAVQKQCRNTVMVVVGDVQGADRLGRAGGAGRARGDSGGELMPGRQHQPEVVEFVRANNYVTGYRTPDGVAFVIPQIAGADIARGAAPTQEAGISERWTYESIADALVEFAVWRQGGFVGEPVNWIRHRPSNRRRRYHGTDAYDEWVAP